MPRYSRTLLAAMVMLSLAVLPLFARLDASIVRRFIYHPTRLPAPLDWGQVTPPQSVVVRTADGLNLTGFRWPATTRDHDTLAFFHGNAGNAYDAALMVAPLRRPDAEIIVASYRGYGDNPGKPSETGLHRDGAAFLGLAKASGGRRLYVFGFSLGGAVALRLGTDPSVTGVATLGAFTRLPALAPRWARALLPDRFDNLAAVQQLRVPYLIAHGSRDEVVPIAHASMLKEAAGAKARLLVIRDGEHYTDLAPIASAIWRHIDEMAARD